MWRLARWGILGLSITMLTGAAPTFWRVSTQVEFLRGEVESLSVDADGHLVLGPVTDELFDTTAPVLWSLASASDGALWTGSGQDGRLYRVEPDGTGGVVFDADELDVHAVAAGPAGTVFAATSPDGRIYQVDADGVTSTVFDPDETYIWALAVGPDGTLHAATGNSARIHRITPDGAATVFFESDATHVLSLAFEADGALLAGTESPGQVLRIDQDGRAFVLLDSPYAEVRSLRVQPDGSVLVVAVNEQGAPAPPAPATAGNTPPTPTVSVTTSVTAVVVANGAATATPPASTNGGSESRGTRGAVYRIAADGLWSELWSSDTDAPYDAVFDGTGALLVGTGEDGKIFQVSEDPPRTVLLGRAPARQVTRFHRQPDGTLSYATANPGKMVRLTGALAERGTYESEVRDAETVATWGTISWRAMTPGGSRVELSSRSGNTAIPNDTWSEWSRPYTDAAGSQIASPKARYLQWRASLLAGDASPILTSVTAAYLPRNVRPAVTQITVHQPGTVFQQPFSSGDPPIAGLDALETESNGSASTLGRESYRKGIQTFVWQATDKNGDQLEYAIAYRREDETAWQTLRSDMRATVFAWDTSAVPDGAYRVRVTVSDATSNAPDTALVGERESPVFDIDNSAPRIEAAAVREVGGRSVLSFTVRDDHSPIQHVELSKGDDTWRTVYPTDGIPDALVETFEVLLDDAGLGAPPVIIRATDALRNTVTVSGR
ncbi:MAG: hypothetical protein CL477_10540 [Acidobacteria bacterium]|nr:hypothetical protein [Acidobacteriota bacterium]MDP7479020.1 WD40 repeat domain-containing protein [Vicinamibacterales bacterium]